WDDALTIALTPFQARRRSLPSPLMVAGEVDRELQRRATRRGPGREARGALHEVTTEPPRRSQDSPSKDQHNELWSLSSERWNIIKPVTVDVLLVFYAQGDHFTDVPLIR